MKILYFHQHFSTPKGSTGSRSYEQAKGLLSEGYQVHMVCGSFDVASTELEGPYTKGKRTGVVEGIQVTEFEIPYSNKDSLVRRSMLFLSFAAKSIGIALTDKYDLIFATSTPLTAALPGIAAKCFRRKPFVFEVRDLWPELPKAMGVIKNPVILSLLSLLEWTAYKCADACIALSPGMRQGIEKRSNSAKPIHVIPNGCDIEFFSADRSNHIDNDVSEEGSFVAIFAGAHGMANGLDAIITAASELQSRRNSSIEIHLMGEGKLKQRLIQRVAEEGIRNVKFLDPLPKIELRTYLHACDVGLMLLANIPAFYYGTSPNKFFDYIASGLPVLVNYPGWVADMVKENDLGMAVEPDSPKLLADALVKMADNRAECYQQGVNALEFGSNNFDRRTLVGQFVDVINDNIQ